MWQVLKNTSPNVIQVSSSILNTISKVIITEKSALRPKKETLLNCPEIPSWNAERPFLSWDFYPNPEKFESDSEINKLSLSLQENMIIEDLLNCMSGIEGKFIKTPSLIDKHAERTFHIDRSLDPAMREVAKRIVPVCANYSLIIRFVEGISLTGTWQSFNKKKEKRFFILVRQEIASSLRVNSYYTGCAR